MKKTLFLILFLSVTPVALSQASNELPDPKTAFLRSMVLPGWGHYYVDQSNWARGKYHLGAEALLLLSYFGLNIHSNNLQQNWVGYARTKAGIDIEGRNPTLQLAVGDFNSLAAYNDFQARSRNWDRFIGDVPRNRWNWQSDAARNEYNDLRSRFENLDRQLPALLGLMVVNRVISAVSAYNRAKKMNRSSSTAFYLSPLPLKDGQGIIAYLKIGF